jgi:hypothetical protein
MAVSTDVGLALLQGGAALTASVVIRGYCARKLCVEMVPTVLLSRIQLCNRLAPMMWLIAAAMVLVGALICLTSS